MIGIGGKKMATTSDTAHQFKPGQRVVVTQQIAQRDEVWTSHVTGEVVRYEQRKTGSWYAGAKDDKLWLDRLTLRKDDGEIVVCHLDPYTHVQWLAEATPADSGSTEHNEPAAPDPVADDEGRPADAA